LILFFYFTLGYASLAHFAGSRRFCCGIDPHLGTFMGHHYRMPIPFASGQRKNNDLLAITYQGKTVVAMTVRDKLVTVSLFIFPQLGG